MSENKEIDEVEEDESEVDPDDITDIVSDVDEGEIDEEDEEDDIVVHDDVNEPTEKLLDSKLVIIEPDKRKTSNALSRFEQSQIISTRAEQIARYANNMSEIDDLTTYKSIAQKEMDERKIPVKVRRIIGIRVVDRIQYKYCEDWDPNEMIILNN